jgi:hypothetical protein
MVSVADPGCLSRIPDPTFFQNCLHPGSRILIKEFKYLTPKKPKKWFLLQPGSYFLELRNFLSSKKYYPGCSSRIRMLTFYPSRIPDPGSATLAVGVDPDPYSDWIQMRIQEGKNDPQKIEKSY